MAKLLDRVDSAATKGARKQATQSHASMFTAHGSQASSSPTIRLTPKNGSEAPKVTIAPKPGNK